MFAAIAEAAPGRRLLEIGSGTGKATTGLVSSGFDVLGLEPGAAMIEAARANPALADVRFERATFEAWNAANAPPFDAVASAQAWHWIDPTVGYAKAAQVLLPGGVLAIFGNVAPFPEGSMKAEVDAAYDRLAPEMSDRGEEFATQHLLHGKRADRRADRGERRLRGGRSPGVRLVSRLRDRRVPHLAEHPLQPPDAGAGQA